MFRAKGTELPSRKQKVNTEQSEEEDSESGQESATNEFITKKKKEYLEQVIYDKNGVFCYQEDPYQYKKARKRL